MKSPLKSKPLRNAGESVDREIQDYVFGDLMTFVLAATFLVAMAVMEWWRWLYDIAPNPGIYTAMAAAAVVCAVWKYKRAKTRVRQLRLGRDGEKAVGQYLELLRENGVKVFHDIPGTGFNIDHVVIHETGIYVIETKTLSKPERGEAKLVYDGETVSKGGLIPDRNPVQQVRAARQWLTELINESTGKKFSARAVVVYPGWYIEPTAEAKSSDVWVLNPKALPAFISKSAAQLSTEDVHLCAYHLGRYIRTAS